MNELATTPGFALLEQSASAYARRVDTLFVTMLGLCGLTALVLAALITWFCVRYRAGARVDRSPRRSQSKGLEAAWTVLPMLLFFAIFAWAARDYAASRRVPADALPVFVVAKQWMWKLQHGNGRREINELHVPLDRDVVLILASQDVIHSFYIPALRLKQDVVPGRYTRLWFRPDRLGDFRLLCAEYCGSEHSAMLGRVIVMRPDDYARWLEGPSAADVGPAPAPLGLALYRRLACGSCHDRDSSVHAPALQGLYGSTVELADGRRIVADDNYLREAIVAPKRHLVRGQPALMPSYADQLDEAQLQQLVAYLRSLREEKPSD